MNVGCGTDISIKELAELVVAEVRYEGEINFDSIKSDGTPRKLMGTKKLNNLGWRSTIKLNEEIRRTISEIKYKIDN